MAVSRSHTWIAGEVLLASDLNSEFNNILTNGTAVAFPATSAVSMGGFALNLDAANTIALTGTTNGIILTGGTLREPAEDTLTAFATGGQTNATALSAAKKFHRISVCATAADSAKLPTSTAGQAHYIRNDGAASAQVFGTSPDTINGVATGTGVALPAGTASWFVCTTAGNWTSTALGPIQSSVLTTKGDILVATASSTAVRKGVGANGQLIVADSTQTDGLIWTDYTRPALNVNPNWLLDQINEGSLYTYSATTAVGPDGWSGSATGAGVFKLRTLADPDSAALKCLEITCTTADASIAAGDNYYVYTAIEGYDSADLKSGTASPSQITVQFKMKSNSVTGVYGVAVQNSAGNRRYIGTITVPDTNENSYSVTLTLDTSGTWLYTSGIGLKLILTLSAGSTFQATAGAWAAGAEQTTSAQANFMSVNTNIIYLKRCHVIPSGVALAYSSQDVQRELARAQRHYEKTYDQGTAVATATTTGCIAYIAAGSGGEAAQPWHFRVTKRSAPTSVLYSPATGQVGARRNATATSDELTVWSLNGTNQLAQHSVGHTDTSVYQYHSTANARLS